MLSVNSGNNFENWHHAFFTSYWPIDCIYVGWKELTFQSHGITHAPLLMSPEKTHRWDTSSCSAFKWVVDI